MAMATMIPGASNRGGGKRWTIQPLANDRAQNIFMGLPEWWTLVPDQSVITNGGTITGDVLNLVLVRQRQWIISMSRPAGYHLNLAKLNSEAASARWIDPASGVPRLVAVSA